MQPNDPYSQGWEAAYDGKDRSACPYKKNSTEAKDWLAGFDEAVMEARANKLERAELN